MSYVVGTVREFAGGKMIRAEEGWTAYTEELFKAFKETGQLSLFGGVDTKGKAPKRKGRPGTQTTLFGDTKADKVAAQKDKVDKQRRKAGENYKGAWPPQGGGWRPVGASGTKGGYKKPAPGGGWTYAYKPKGGEAKAPKVEAPKGKQSVLDRELVKVGAKLDALEGDPSTMTGAQLMARADKLTDLRDDLAMNWKGGAAALHSRLNVLSDGNRDEQIKRAKSQTDAHRAGVLNDARIKAVKQARQQPGASRTKAESVREAVQTAKDALAKVDGMPGELRGAALKEREKLAAFVVKHDTSDQAPKSNPKIDALVAQLEATGLLDKTDFSRMAVDTLEKFTKQLSGILGRARIDEMQGDAKTAVGKAQGLLGRMHGELSKRQQRIGELRDEAKKTLALDRGLAELRAVPGLIETFSGFSPTAESGDWAPMLSPIGGTPASRSAEVKNRKKLQDMGMIDMRLVNAGDRFGGTYEYKLHHGGQQVWDRLTDEERGTRKTARARLDAESTEAAKRMRGTEGDKPKRKTKAQKGVDELRSLIKDNDAISAATKISVTRTLDVVASEYSDTSINSKSNAESMLSYARQMIKDAGHNSVMPKLRGKVDEAVWATIKNQARRSGVSRRDFDHAQLGASRARVDRSIDKLVKQGFLREDYEGHYTVLKKSIPAEELAGGDPLAKSIADSYENPGSLGHNRGW